MQKEDWTVPALLAEAVCVILEVVYIGLQFYYGYMYHVTAYKIVFNILVSVLLYAALTLFAVYPERINRLPPELCAGRVRKLSIRMMRVLKLVVVVGLMVPCVADAADIIIQDAYSLIVMFVMIAVAVYYEARIYLILRNKKNNRRQ